MGHCTTRLFGLLPSERLERQASSLDLILVADASAVLDGAAVDWLQANPGTMLADERGKLLAVAVEAGRVEAATTAIEGRSGDFPVATTTELGDRFVRKLRRRSPILAFSLNDVPVAKAERMLFANVYKGITDVVTKYVWPLPAYAVTKAASRLGIPPNAVTMVGIIMTVVAGWLFYIGDLGSALAAAWTMTFLDTVDGKLARVTVTSSRLGNFLDHGTDVVHPPLWWLALAHGLALNQPAASDSIWLACWIILGAYVLGRVIERMFRKRFGFNAYMFARFDSLFRLVVARRNILLLILTIGLLARQPEAAFWACAIWSIVSIIIQGARLAEAHRISRNRAIVPWIA